MHGSLIANHIGEVAVELCHDREAKAQARKVDDKKGVPDLLGTNQTYLIYLGKFFADEYLPPI